MFGDAQDNMLTITDALNHTTTYDYTPSGRVKTVTDSEGHLVVLMILEVD